VLRYTRQKTDVLATIPLPEHLIILLRGVPLEADSVGPHQPFRSQESLASINATTWRMRLHRVFELSGIAEVTTGLGRVRRPHPKMIRDTFAIYHLRQGVPIYSVSRMLGHTRTEQTETAYLPYVAELDAAHIAAVRKTMTGTPRKGGRKVVQMQ
jgi:integrase